MDIFATLASSRQQLVCIDMHTTGEPTRIVLSGYPSLLGTLLEQRAKAKANRDHIRKSLILEPRGHFDMYAAVLRPDTELTKSGQAHMGVLFMTNDGYSTMCGHATIALGRFLLDTQDLNVFPRRNDIAYDMVERTARLNLHAPCGLIEVTVPITSDLKSDPTRAVSFICVPSFATGIDIPISLSPQYHWPELHGKTKLTADFSYGGAFYCMVSAAELGFSNNIDDSIDLEAMNKATKNLKAAINNDPNLRYLFQHPDHEDLGFLYSIIVVYPPPLSRSDDIEEEELGICFFADQQLDRSPTGSGVAARVALAYARHNMKIGMSRTYHSLVSKAYAGQGGFTGSVIAELSTGHDGSGGSTGGVGDAESTKLKYPTVKVRVEGKAWYTGTHTFVFEDSDMLGRDDFVFEKLARRGHEDSA